MLPLPLMLWEKVKVREKQMRISNKTEDNAYLYTGVWTIEKLIWWADGETERHLTKVIASNFSVTFFILHFVDKILFCFENWLKDVRFAMIVSVSANRQINFIWIFVYFESFKDSQNDVWRAEGDVFPPLSTFRTIKGTFKVKFH